MDKLIEILDTYFVKKVPALPANVKEILVKIAPWITILGIVISVPAVLAIIGLSGLLTIGSGFQYQISVVFIVVVMMLRGLSIPGLMSKSIKGWMWLFYAVIADAIYAVVSFNIVGGLIGVLISLYFLFQVKEFYK